MSYLSLWRRHLVNAYKIKASICVIAGKTVWSTPERLECEVLQKERYINLLSFLPSFIPSSVSFRMTLSDLEWLKEMFNDTKRSVTSLTTSDMISNRSLVTTELQLFTIGVLENFPHCRPNLSLLWLRRLLAHVHLHVHLRISKLCMYMQTERHRPHSIILASCKTGCKPGRKPGLDPGLQLARIME